MAEAKKTAVKKAAPKKKAEKVVSEKSLHDQLAEKRADLLGYQKSHAAGELVNPRAITVARKDIARIMTKINQEKEGK